MRTNLAVLAAAATLLGAVPSVSAKDTKPAAPAIVGGYEVKYDEVANNCSTSSMVLTRGVLTIAPHKGGQVEIDIERIPLMLGKPGRAGKVKATSKLGPTSIQGLDGKFSVAGKVDDGVLQLVFVAEYYANKKPLCTQSWNVSGLRADQLK